jgi:hypothetical protein
MAVWSLPSRILCWAALLSFFLIQNVKSETFLEKQKRIAEENWKRDQEQQQNVAATVAVDGESESEYYYYYETETNQAEYEKEKEEEPPPPPPKKHGYQKSSTTFSRKPGPLSLSSLIGEFKEQLNCLTELELTREVDRVVSKIIHPHCPLTSI